MDFIRFITTCLPGMQPNFLQCRLMQHHTTCGNTCNQSSSYLDLDFFFLLGVGDGDLEESLSESGRILE